MDIGAQLRAAREAKGLSVSTLAERTRVPARALAAIELNDQSSLPPHPFGRGFVRTYAEEVDLDPDRLVQEYFSQFLGQRALAPVGVARGAPERVWLSSSRWMRMGTAAAIVLVIVAVVMLGRRGDRTAEPDGVGTTGASPSTPAPTGSAAQPIAQPDAAPSPAIAPAAAAPSQSAAQSGALTVVLSMSRPCWVMATVDGRRTIYGVLQPGERQTLVGERAIAIRLGDAGAVRWTINGRDAGSPGGDGEVRDARITTENAATVR
jgi:transcriptional regulator with XRE-family HTH domain